METAVWVGQDAQTIHKASHDSCSYRTHLSPFTKDDRGHASLSENLIFSEASLPPFNSILHRICCVPSQICNTLPYTRAVRSRPAAPYFCREEPKAGRNSS
eukprot:TRINITY_DN15960_c0_g1_i4.p1 TRINITY_DN15960_c0_g1~~TRINITY_DN15960_c0_g1_i4.p1  ORF type:complete len:101 (+),score=1.72 TRINITY_DN15960_c0_g1_i4:332-634(+)